jgi:hypothetical protein
MQPDVNSPEEPKGRRVTIDLTPAAASEVDRLRKLTGLTTADVFRYALSLFRIYIDAKQRGRELEIVDPAGEDRDTRVELPVVIAGPSQE